jgi:WD40 repeat protein
MREGRSGFLKERSGSSLNRITAIAATSLDGNHLIISGSADGTIRVWDATTGAPVGRPLRDGHYRRVASVTVTQRHSPVIIAGNDAGQLVEWDLRTQTLIRTWRDSGDSATSFASARLNEREIVVASHISGAIQLWDVERGELIRSIVQLQTLRDRGAAFAIIVLENGLMAIIVSAKNRRDLADSFVFDAASGRQIGHILANPSDLTDRSETATALACTHFGASPVVASGSWNGNIMIWNLNTGSLMGSPLAGHTEEIRALIFLKHEDDTVMVSAAGDRAIQVWRFDVVN